MQHSNIVDHWDLASTHANTGVAQKAAQFPPQSLPQLPEQDINAVRHSLASMGVHPGLQEHVGDHNQELNIGFDEEETP